MPEPSIDQSRINGIVIAQLSVGKAWIRNVPKNPKRVVILGAVFFVSSANAIALTALIRCVNGSSWPVLVGAPSGLQIGFKAMRRLRPTLRS